MTYKDRRGRSAVEKYHNQMQNPPGLNSRSELTEEGLSALEDRLRDCSPWSVAQSRLALVQVTLWTVAHQAPLSMGFFRQEYWGGSCNLKNKEKRMKKKKNKHKPEHPINVTKLSVAACV